MAITKLTTDLAIISKLSDEPNDVDGLSGAELKAKFDEAGLTIQDYINDTLIPELGGEGAAEAIGIAPVPGLTGIEDLQNALVAIVEMIQEITQGSVADGSITTAKLADIAVTTAKIASAAVTAAKLADNAVTTAKVVDLAVTAAKLAANAVETAKIADGAVTADKIAAEAVTHAKIGTAAVGADNIDSYAVTEAKLAGSSVTGTKIASGAVSTTLYATIPANGWSYDGPPYMQEVTVSGLVPEDAGDPTTTVTWTCNSSDPDVVAAFDLIDRMADTDAVVLSTDTEITVDVPIIATQNSTPHTFTALANGWTATGAPMVQTVSVSGILSSDDPIVDVVPSDDYETATQQMSDFGSIYRITTADGEITCYADGVTVDDVPVKMKAVRK